MLEDLFERSGAALAVADPDGRVVRANRALCDLLGRSEADLVGRRLNEFADEGEPALDERIAAGEIVSVVEKRYRRPDGSVVWTEARGQGVRDPQGELLYLVRHLADVTRRREAERMAGVRLAQQQALVTLSREGLEEADEQRLFDRAAAVLAEHLSVDRAVVIEVFEAQDRARLRSSRGVKTGQGNSDEVPLTEMRRFVMRAEGAVVTERLLQETRFEPDPHLAAAGINSTAGAAVRVDRELWGMVGVGTTAVDQYSAEDAVFVQGVADVLGVSIARRRHEQAAQSALEQERLASLGALAAGIAHDIGNALAVVKNHAQLLAAVPSDEQRVTGAATSIATAADHMVELVDRILDLARASAVQLRPVETVDLLEKLLPVLRRLVPPTILLELDRPPDLCHARLDPTAAQQMIFNLVMNAVDALPGGGTVTLSCRPERGGVTIEVADTGTGMTSDVAQRATEPFFTTKGGGRTGLGLPQVAALVEEHRGTTTIDSAPGRGTSVRLWFPAEHPVSPGDPGHDVAAAT